MKLAKAVVVGLFLAISWMAQAENEMITSARNSVANSEETLKIVEERFNKGQASAADVQEAKKQLSDMEKMLADFIEMYPSKEQLEANKNAKEESKKARKHGSET